MPVSDERADTKSQYGIVLKVSKGNLFIHKMLKFPSCHVSACLDTYVLTHYYYYYLSITHVVTINVLNGTS